MRTSFLFTAFAACSLLFAACGEDKPDPVVRETRVVHHYHSADRPAVSNNPDNFEPVERPATYSR